LELSLRKDSTQEAGGKEEVESSEERCSGSPVAESARERTYSFFADSFGYQYQKRRNVREEKG